MYDYIWVFVGLGVLLGLVAGTYNLGFRVAFVGTGLYISSVYKTTYMFQGYTGRSLLSIVTSMLLAAVIAGLVISLPSYFIGRRSRRLIFS